jgi:osmoprotectant transport system ATP-binding protein
MPTVGVEFAKVSYTLAGGRVLLRDISLQLETGTTTALLGRSGSGKTTLLRMINGLVTPTSGEVRVGGKATRDYDLVALRRSIGYVIQETGLFPHMTVERNAGMALELAGYSAGEKNARVGQVLELAGLDFEEYRRRYPWQLSGGQRQRVGLARALATDPQVLLMDEPFGALDPLTRAEMQTMLLGLLERVKKTVVLVTHDLEEALYLASRVIFVSDGAIVGDMTPEEVSKSENHYVKNYVRAVHHWEPK